MKPSRKKKSAPKNPVAQAMAAMRWKNTTLAERKQSAKHAAAARWKTKKTNTQP